MNLTPTEKRILQICAGGSRTPKQIRAELGLTPARYQRLTVILKAKTGLSSLRNFLKCRDFLAGKIEPPREPKIPPPKKKPLQTWERASVVLSPPSEHQLAILRALVRGNTEKDLCRIFERNAWTIRFQIRRACIRLGIDPKQPHAKLIPAIAEKLEIEMPSSNVEDY